MVAHTEYEADSILLDPLALEGDLSPVTLEPSQANSSGPEDSEATEELRHPLRQILLNELSRQATPAWGAVLSQLLSLARASALEALLRQSCKAAAAASSRPWLEAHVHFALLFAEAPSVKGMPAKEHQAAELLMGLHLAELAKLAYKGAGDVK
ncbi:hypothetical protein [Variovorax guangxiensis]|uniref:hypothetical protein n=1 Tax=Variovorax guangxiensis TaxID=1775474 RepID=UPI002867AA1C|nr:hypothetical protein [Variovorax guangxiensis]MDR6859824.1 hypothetical protein [Variovorax guangxiensis]